MKGKDLRKLSLHGKIAATVLLKLIRQKKQFGYGRWLNRKMCLTPEHDCY